jgi:hypothetical protein
MLLSGILDRRTNYNTVCTGKLSNNAMPTTRQHFSDRQRY